jgi:hypothetical protein
MITLTIKHLFENEFQLHNDTSHCYKGENLTTIDNMDVWFFAGNIFEENHLRAPHRNNDKIYQLNDYMDIQTPIINITTTCPHSKDIPGELIKNSAVKCTLTSNDNDVNREYLYKFDTGIEDETLYAHLMINYDGGYCIRFYDTAQQAKTISSNCAHFDMVFTYIEGSEKLKEKR